MMSDLEKIGQILTLLFHYAKDEDIFQLIKFYHPYVSLEQITRNGLSLKGYLLQQLCEPQYKIFESVYKDDLKQVKKYLNTSRLEILIYHLLTLHKCYFHNFLFITHEEVKGNNTKIFAEKRLLEAIKGQSSSKCGLEKLLKEGNIKEKEITRIINILIDNYKKYGFYYLLDGDTLNKVEITYIKGKCKYYKTPYDMKLLAKKTKFINIKTNHEITINKAIKQFFVNKYGKTDIFAIKFSTFQKINNAICEGLCRDVPKDTCAWCNPKKNRQNPNQLCDNCTFLLEKLRLLQSKKLINRFDINAEINTYTWKDFKTLKGLRKKRKEHLIELLGTFYGLNPYIATELKDMIAKSFREFD